MNNPSESPSPRPPAATPPPAYPPPPAPRGNTGLFVVGLLAVLALALAGYAWYSQDNDAARSRITSLELKVADLERRVAAGDPTGAGVLSLLGKKRTAADADPAPAADTAAPSTPKAIPVAMETPAPTSTPSDKSMPQATPPTSAASSGTLTTGAYELVPNAGLKGRLGRIVLTFPAGAQNLKARTDLYRKGDDHVVRTDYGNVAFDTPAGTYDLVIGDRRVADVRVEPRTDTRVFVGVLRLNASGNTRFDLYAAGTDQRLDTFYGQNDIGLAVGDYEIEVNNQRERVSITRDTITEY